MTVLALDFDGVICDSAEEVLQTALGAWSEVSPDSRLQTEVESRPDRRATFERLVPLGNRAEDFGVALHILHTGLEIHTQADYDRVRDRLGPEWLDRFHHLFYRTRNRLRTDDPERWLGLHRTYGSFTETLERHQRNTTLAIVTAKDGDSVRLLLAHFGIDHLFRDNLILDKETGVAKT
ncbi:MAG: HAD family hydrolase, partial [Acidobacteriota bacterium]